MSRRTINIPDHLDAQFDEIPNKSEFVQFAVESIPILKERAISNLKGKFTQNELKKIYDAFQGIPFVVKLANIETLRTIVKDINIIKKFEKLHTFDIFFLIKMICDAWKPGTSELDFHDLSKKLIA